MVTKNKKEVNLTGTLCLFHEESDLPVLYYFSGDKNEYVALFSSLEKANEFIAHPEFRPKAYSLRQLTDGEEFLRVLPYKLEDEVYLQIMLDPHKTDTGTIKFLEVDRLMPVQPEVDE